MRTIERLICRMRDGIQLVASVYLPDEDGRYPVILMRTPYGRHGILEDPLYGWFPTLVSDGYVVVSQDMRGTGDSDGELGLNGQNEHEDGYDSVECLREQSFCDGSIGMFGLSYPGFVQTAAATYAPEALKAICPFMSPSQHPFGVRQPHVLHMEHLFWAYAQLLARPERYLPNPGISAKVLPILRKNMQHLEEDIFKLPLNKCPAAMIPGVPMLKDYLDIVNGIEDPLYWEKMHMPVDFNMVHVPALFGTGWLDGALEWTIEGYRAARMSTDPITREEARLIIGPWTHGGDLPGRVEDLDFGIDSDSFKNDIRNVMHRWFDCWLKGIDSDAMPARVRYFILGVNEWREAEDWPPVNSTKALYLGQDGVLTNNESEQIQTISYVADPTNPTPSRIIDYEGRSIVSDWSQISTRPDVLLFVSEELKTPIEVAGIAQMHLKAYTDVENTDFVCRILDIDENGRQTALTTGLIRGTYRHNDKYEPIKPGEVTTFDWEVGSLAMVFGKGHRIGIQICSYLYPLCNRNLNTGEDIASGINSKAAYQTLVLGGEDSSCIYLPFIERI